MCEDIVERSYYILCTCISVVLSDIYTMMYTLYRYSISKNMEIVQHFYNQLSFFINKVESFTDYLKDTTLVSSGVLMRLRYLTILLEDLRDMLWRCLITRESSHVLSISLIVINILRMLRKLIENIYSTASTIFDKYIKLLD